MDMDTLLAATKDFSGVSNLIVNIILVIIASSVIIEISPIKINPIKWLFGFISKSFKGWFEDVIDSSLDKQLAELKEDDKRRDVAIDNLAEKVDQMSESVTTMREKIDANEEKAQLNHIYSVRRSILSFADNLRSGMKPSKESFDNILEFADEYSEYCVRTGMKNGKVKLSLAFIQEQYQIAFNKVND